MKCPKCKSDDVNISIEQTGSKTKKSGVGFGGHMNNMARGMTAIATLGMSNLVWKKAKGSEKSVATTEKVCLCQNCGYSWTIK